MDKWGFFVIEPSFKPIKNDQTFLEKEPLEKVAKKGKLLAINITEIGSAWILKEIKKYSKIF